MYDTSKQDNNAGDTSPAAIPSARTAEAANETVKPADSGLSAINDTGNMTVKNITSMEPVIKKQFSSGQVGVPDTTNALSVRPTPRPAPVAQPVQQPVRVPTQAPVQQPAARPAGGFGATSAGGFGAGTPTPSQAPAATATPTPAATPTPVPTQAPEESSRPFTTVLPRSIDLLAKPLSHQSNKPFTDALDPDYNPRTACRDDVRNISGWNRLTTNVMGRSGIDSTYMGNTSSPVYMNPWNVIKLADQFTVMSETKNMTHPGTYLQQRMWSL
jgi:hypothetical protein